jgi:hypothetical protein
MNAQIELDFKRSRTAAQAGIQKAIDHANAVNKDWQTKAFDFLTEYIKTNRIFMVEDVRFASQSIIPSPPSQRAWGAVIRKAVKDGLIEQNGYQKVKNVNAHSTPAAVWKTTTP